MEALEVEPSGTCPALFPLGYQSPVNDTHELRRIPDQQRNHERAAGCKTGHKHLVKGGPKCLSLPFTSAP